MRREEQQQQQQQQQQQLNAFLASVEKRALRMAEIATRNRDDALELVQGAMLGLVKHYGQHEPESWPPLFHRMLQNSMRDRHLHHKLRATFTHWFSKDENPRGLIESVPAPRSIDPALELGLSDAGVRLVKALLALSLRQQQVFMLRMWEGLTLEETATAMTCSTGNVKTDFSRATSKLKTELEDDRIKTDKPDFELFASQRFDETIEHMDHNTATRLSLMRHQAIESIADRKQNRVILLSLGAAMAVFLLVWMMPAPEKPGPDLTMPEGQAVAMVMDDFDLLTSDIELDLLENIEFYQWLEESKHAG